MTTIGHPTPVRNKAGEIVGTKPSVVSRMTRSRLAGNYGVDKDKRLVISLVIGDLVTVKPERCTSKRTLSITAQDLWAYLNRCEASRVRAAKIADRKIRRSLK